MAALKTSNTYLTSAGLKHLEEELALLKEQKLPEITERLYQARESDDTEENADYESALDEHGLVISRISELEKMIREAKLIQEKHQISETVSLGSTVLVDMDGNTTEYTLVGKVEANPSQKRISNESPIGSALMGAKKGDEVEINTPAKNYRCKIIEIR